MKRYCPKCKTDTNRDIINVSAEAKTVEYFAKDSNGKIKDKFYSVHYIVSIFSKCKGCETPTLTIDEYRPKWLDESYSKKFIESIYKHGESKELKPNSTNVYPPNIQMPFPEWIKDLPEEIMLLAFEVYRAFSNKMYTLTSMGIRTLVDSISTIKIGDIGGFEQKIKRLTSEGYISKEQEIMLLGIVEIGHASSHRSFKPNEDDVKDCLDILNHVMEVEKLSETAISLKNKTPKRSIKKK